ncbi:hypothetical protein [Arenimonas sp. MALMAid1274]|uniref:hypothetical protein n=1 Tax=Arenimonas sp. MALMAid1274 TaxID=3411630 RepID=UPI003BA1966C
MIRILPFLMAALLALAGPWAAAPARAQAGDPAAHMAALRAQLAPGKQTFIARQMGLTPAEEASFWPHYDQHQKDLAELVQRRRENAAAAARAATAGTLEADEYEDIAEEALEIDADEAGLTERTYSRLSRVIPPSKALKFVQLEAQVAALLRYELAATYPLGN